MPPPARSMDVERDAFSDRIDVRPVSLRHFVIDDDNLRTDGAVLFREQPPFEQRDLERREEPRAHGALIAPRSRLARCRLIPFDAACGFEPTMMLLRGPNNTTPTRERGTSIGSRFPRLRVGLVCLC